MNFKQLRPMLPVDQPLDDEAGFVHEIKWDGFRVLAHLTADGVLLSSRNGRNLNSRFPHIVSLLRQLNQNAILDGEIIALNFDGQIDFSLLRQTKLASYQVRYIVFDLLYLNEESLLELPWHKRRARLEEQINSGESIMISPLLPGDLQSNLLFAKEQKLEGIISKQKESPYLPGVRSPLWRKHKIQKTLDCIVIGLRLRAGKVSSMAVGVYQQGTQLRYIGNVGSGLGQTELSFLRESINLLAQDTPPVHDPPAVNGDWVWFRPHLVVEVGYLEFTTLKRLRHPVFLRFRFDKEPSDCRLEGV